MKRALSLIVSLCMIVCCTACSSIKKTDKIDVIVWHRWNVAEGEGEHELQVAVDSFNNSQDRINVILEAQPSSDFTNKVYTATANGVGPDIFFEFATVVPEYLPNHLVANMEEYIDVDNLKERLSPSIWDEAWSSGDGHLHVIPIQTTAPVLFYNKTLYDKYNLVPPTTWEMLGENSKVIYENEGKAGFAADSLIDLAQMFIGQLGMTYIDTETKTVGFNQPAFREIIDWYAGEVADGCFATDFSSGSIDGDFNAGLIASFVGTCSYEPYILPDGFEYDVAPVPVVESSMWIPVWNRGAIVLSSDKETEAAACEFVEYFTNAENNKRWCTSIGALSPYADTCELSEYKDYIANDKILNVSTDLMPYAGTLPAVNGAVAVRNEIKQFFLQVIGDVKTSEEALNEAEINCNEALQK